MRILIIFITLLSIAASAADRYTPAPYGAQTLNGLLGERLDINRKLRLLQVDEQALLEGFETPPGKHPWIGEHVGKFLDAASNAWQYSHDEQLKTLMDRMARRLIAAQSKDGYLGTYLEKDRWTSWDVWSHKYDLLGLLRYYEVTKYDPALQASRRIGDLMVNTFGDGPGKRDIIKAGTHVGMASTSILEPMAVLYRVTGEKKYLEFCHYLVRSWDQPNGPKILSSLLSNGGNVYRTANAKAYEMMSNLVGLAELYRIEAKPEYLKALRDAWADIRAHRLYIVGTTSAGEHFQDGGVLPGIEGSNVGEGCATVTWLQLNTQLLRLTGEAQFAEEIERTVYNQLLAAQERETGRICYFTPLIGKKRADKGITCCQSSEPRGISMIPSLTWGGLDGGIAVLLYSAGQVKLDVKGNAVVVRSATEFPRSGLVKLTLDPERAASFPLMLRVPAWTKQFRAKAGGKTLIGKPGEYLTIERQWKKGDTVEIDMDLTVETLRGEPSYEGLVAVRRGPQVLALERELNPDFEWMHLAAPVLPLKLTVAQNAPLAAGWAGVPVYEAAARVGKIRLIPYSDTREYRVWLPRPEAVPQGPVALTLFGHESRSKGGYELGSICDGKPETYRTTKQGKPREEEFFAVEMVKPGKVGRVVYQQGKTTEEGGWFAEAPRVEIRRAGSEKWELAGTLAGYAGKPNEGQAFTLTLPAPVEAVAVRVVGKPGGQYISCAELTAWRD